ncbi:MAG: hypothetical protein FD177_641 [Desulfovibrionaceae bacterium]|nr:MAG: hypothetical protein FD177_641 [Desulfovibrionaceae bacterium]
MFARAFLFACTLSLLLQPQEVLADCSCDSKFFTENQRLEQESLRILREHNAHLVPGKSYIDNMTLPHEYTRTTLWAIYSYYGLLSAILHSYCSLSKEDSSKLKKAIENFIDSNTAMSCSIDEKLTKCSTILQATGKIKMSEDIESLRKEYDNHSKELFNFYFDCIAK